MDQIYNAAITRKEIQEFLSERYARNIIVEKISVGVILDSNEGSCIIIETTAKEIFVTSNETIKDILKKFKNPEKVNNILNLETTITKDNEVGIMIWWR